MSRRQGANRAGRSHRSGTNNHLPDIRDCRLSIPGIIDKLIDIVPDRKDLLDSAFKRLCDGTIDKARLQIELLSIVGKDAIKQALTQTHPRAVEVIQKVEAEKLKSDVRKRKCLEEQTTCLICYTEFEDAMTKVQCHKCGYVICRSCMTKWVHNCPYCRAKRKPSLPIRRLLHSYHCNIPECTHSFCASTKKTVGQMAVHAESCRVDGCHHCKLWNLLKQSKTPEW